MRGLRRGISLVAVVVLMMVQMLPAAALPMGGGNPGGGEGSPRPDVSVGDWDALKDWLWAAGGTATLTGDIVLPAGESATVPLISPGANAVLDCGVYTIYVEGGLFIEAASGLTVCGAGGEAGLFHVREGGAMTLSYLTLTASDGAALVQEEGSLVTLSSGESNEDRVTVSGDVRFATMPVLSRPHAKHYMDTPYVLIPEETDYETLLPKTRQANLHFEGEQVTLGTSESQDGYYGFQQTVAWDISDEQVEAMAGRKRTSLGGHFIGALNAPGFSHTGEAYRALFEPSVLAVFPVDGAALLECGFADRTGALQLAFTFSPAPEVYRLLRSDDKGTNWTTIGEDCVPEVGEASRWELTHWLDTDEDRAAWYLVEGQYTEEDGVRLVHTDTITVTGVDVLPVSWVDGHRGGGEDIVGGEPSPPTVIRPTDPPQLGGPDESTDGEGRPGIPPPLVIAPRPTPTPEAAPLPKPTPEVVPLPKPTPEVAPLPKPTPEVAPLPELTPEVAPLPKPTPEVAPLPELTPEVAPLPTQTQKPLVQEGVRENAGTVRTRIRTHQKEGAEAATPAPSVLPTETPKPVPVKAKVAPVAPQVSAELEPTAPQEESAHALAPGAQIAIGCGILALLLVGAAVVLNPGMVRRRFRRNKEGR